MQGIPHSSHAAGIMQPVSPSTRRLSYAWLDAGAGVCSPLVGGQPGGPGRDLFGVGFPRHACMLRIMCWGDGHCFGHATHTGHHRVPAPIHPLRVETSTRQVRRLQRIRTLRRNRGKKKKRGTCAEVAATPWNLLVSLKVRRRFWNPREKCYRRVVSRAYGSVCEPVSEHFS